MSNQPIIAVYEPPEAGFPWLAVTISPDGTVAATAHATFDAVEATTLKNLSAASKGLGGVTVFVSYAWGAPGAPLPTATASS